MQNQRDPIFVKSMIFLSVLCVLLAATAGVCAARAHRLEAETIRTENQALSVLCAQLDTVETALQKGVFAQSAPMLSSLSDKLQHAAAGAKLSLSLLPDEGTGAARIFRFLSQVADYTATLRKQLETGKALTAKQRQSLRDLYRYASDLGDGLRNIRDGLDDGRVTLRASLSTLPQPADTAIFSDAFSSAEQSLTDYPTLLYDGPFADARLNRTAKALENLDEISLQTARARAAKALACAENELVRESDEDSALALYCFSKAGRTVGFTKRGGLLCYLTNPNYAGKSEISEESAVKVARAFLRDCGYKNMKESYYSTYDGVCTVNFAYREKGVTYYADLIKVSVALDTARVVAMDARGYLMNHTARKVPDVKVALKTAVQGLSDELDLLDHQTAMIPREDGTEALCHELHCRDKTGKEVLVYADTQQPGEADIKLLLYADDGVLAK